MRRYRFAPLALGCTLVLGACGAPGINIDDSALQNKNGGDKSTSPTCTTQAMGDSTSCKDAGTWKQYAADACTSQGMTLTDLAVDTVCGTGQYRYAKYQCCKSGQPQPQPPPPSCTTQAMGDSTSCKDAAIWKQYAADACTAQGLVLMDIAVDVACGTNQYRYVKFQCCKSDPPPPSSCTAQSLGGSTSCKDSTTWKQYATDACTAQGLTLVAVSAYDDCGTDQYRYVKFECCKTSEPQPSSCTTRTQGGDTSCKDAAIWAQYAAEDCNTLGQVATSISPWDDCGTKQYRYVKYACCSK